MSCVHLLKTSQSAGAYPSVFALIALPVGLLIGCGVQAPENSGAGGGMPTGSSCPTTQTLTYGTFGQPFLTSYCTRCHSSVLSGDARKDAPEDHNFDTVLGVRGFLDHIDEAAAAGPDAVNTRMPPSDPRPTLGERQKLGEWLACGAPE